MAMLAKLPPPHENPQVRGIMPQCYITPPQGCGYALVNGRPYLTFLDAIGPEWLISNAVAERVIAEGPSIMSYRTGGPYGGREETFHMGPRGPEKMHPLLVRVFPEQEPERDVLARITPAELRKSFRDL